MNDKDPSERPFSIHVHKDKVEPRPGILFAGREERNAFVAKFGREPTEEDPWYFDPDQDTPQPYSRESVRNGTAKICQWMIEVFGAEEPEGDPSDCYGQAIIFASRKTGLVVDQFSYVRLAKHEREAYNEALEEYWEFTDDVVRWGTLAAN